MKKLVLFILTVFMGLASTSAQPVFPDFTNWKRLVCNIVPKGTTAKGRSALYVPELYYSDQYITVQSDAANYGCAYITLVNSQGETVKEGTVEVVAGGDNLYYIGDLDGGTYEVTVEFDGFILTGELDY